ncbi:unnamed protein product [Tilletia laevis]|uniref:Uncharacterized protein n=2 Tax=Tilletia TaxID=13289 RepID=A0A9N8LKU3_9BASI|nr:hypothetical protein CF335_g5041 [Tilletia laevis]KAE8248196.1 hypothetical protein A4X03_0g6846 [Tilletia caries]CAD6920676.1 unnamed protein product [Tilletia laevis]CAD6941696.1 unnamed protein product [Tilletia caries]
MSTFAFFFVRSGADESESSPSAAAAAAAAEILFVVVAFFIVAGDKEEEDEEDFAAVAVAAAAAVDPSPPSREANATVLNPGPAPVRTAFFTGFGRSFAAGAGAGAVTKYNPLLHGGIRPTIIKRGKQRIEKREVLAIQFVKRYIQYAKTRIQPVLTQAAAEYIVNVYAGLRNDELTRLSREVEEEDTEAAEEILRFALFKEIVRPGAGRNGRSAKRRRTTPGGGDDDSDADDFGDGDDDDDEDGGGDEKKKGGAASYMGTGKYGTRGARSAGTGAGAEELQSLSLDSPSRRPAPVRRGPLALEAAVAASSAKSPIGGGGEGEEEHEDMDALDAMRAMEDTTPKNTPAASSRRGSTPVLSPPPPAASASSSSAVPAASTAPSLPPARLNSFRSRLAALFARGGALSEEDYGSLADVLEGVNRGLPARDVFSDAEAREALRVMGEADEIKFSDDVVYKV